MTEEVREKLGEVNCRLIDAWFESNKKILCRYKDMNELAVNSYGTINEVHYEIRISTPRHDVIYLTFTAECAIDWYSLYVYIRSMIP
jgi:hypothetical protein